MKKLLFSVIVILTLSSSFVFASEIGYTNISEIALYKNPDYTSKVNDRLKISTKLEIIDENDEGGYFEN